MKRSHQEIIAGLDIGSTQIRAAIGKRCDGGIEVIGVGQSPSRGIRKGLVINLETTADAIRQAVDEAELMAGCQVKNVVVGIADRSMRSHYSHGEAQVKQGTVSKKDTRNAIASARKIQLPSDCKILHSIAVEFVIDKETRTSQPLGMIASTLEVKLHIVTVASASIKNIVNACKLAGLKRLHLVLQSLATAETLLLPVEREQGVVHIDIGGGSEKVAVFSNNSLWFYNQSTAIGNHLTEDVAVGLRISMVQAAQVKRLHGCCLENMADSNYKVEVIPYKGNGTRLIARKFFAEIIGPRMEEMFTQVARKLQQSEYNGKLVAGAVITGGTSLLMDIEELAKQVLNMPVRIGSPGTIDGLVDTISQPQHCTAVALALFGARKDGIPQGITARGGNSVVLRTTLAIKHLMEKLDRHTHANTVVKTDDGFTIEYPLFYAISCGDEAEARRLLAAGADPNKQTAHGTTPLMQAVYGCSLEMIADLLEAGADPLIRDKRGFTVLTHALQRRDSGTSDIFKVLPGLIADHHLDGNGFSLDDHVMMRVLRHKNAGCDVPFDVSHVALTEAAIEGNSQVLSELLLDDFPRCILTNAMVLASERDHLLCVRALIAKNADINDRSIFGNTPLGMAAAGLYPELVKYLLEAGAKVNSRNEEGETPLYEACTSGALDHDTRRTFEQRLVDQVEVARILLDAGVDVNMCSDRGWSPISEVIFTAQNPALVRLLLERGAVPPPIKDASGNRKWMLSTHWNREIREMLGHCRSCSCEHKEDPLCTYRCYL